MVRVEWNLHDVRKMNEFIERIGLRGTVDLVVEALHEMQKTGQVITLNGKTPCSSEDINTAIDNLSGDIY